MQPTSLAVTPTAPRAGARDAPAASALMLAGYTRSVTRVPPTAMFEWGVKTSGSVEGDPGVAVDTKETGALHDARSDPVESVDAREARDECENDS